jgi:alkyldihydroxyacetonephosphate synthase
VLDPGEAQAAAGMDGESALLVLGFESSDLPQDSQMRDALQIARSNGGTVLDQGAADPVATWRRSFIDMPYVWNTLLGVGLINDTFETAITWDRWPAFDSAVRTAVQGALNQVCGGGSVTCRFTHVYTDGPAPYYTFAGLGRRGSEVEMWRELKQAASDAVIAAGGTITHHHAVGREHAPWYSRERPDLFAAAMNAARNVLDPRGVMNPGVLWTE